MPPVIFKSLVVAAIVCLSITNDIYRRKYKRASKQLSKLRKNSIHFGCMMSNAIHTLDKNTAVEFPDPKGSNTVHTTAEELQAEANRFCNSIFDGIVAEKSDKTQPNLTVIVPTRNAKNFKWFYDALD